MSTFSGLPAKILGRFAELQQSFAVQRAVTAKAAGSPRAVSTWPDTGDSLVGILTQPDQRQRERADQAQYPLTDVLITATPPGDVRPGDRLVAPGGGHYYVTGVDVPFGIYGEVHLERRGDA